MGLFSKPNVPSIDVGALRRIAEQNAQRQRGVIGGLRTNLQPLTADFESKRNALSAGIPGQTESLLETYGRDLSGVNAKEQEAGQQAGAAFREQSFRDVPEIQRAIRESLGAAGTTGNAAALSSVARPILDANRSSRDFNAMVENQRLQNVAGRSEKLADTGFNARSSAAATKLGLDKDTIDYLQSIGREDLIREAEGVLGIEEQLGSNNLAIEQARQQNEIAKAAAANARRSGIISSLGSLAGTGIGAAFGGPLGASLGSQIGGIAGNLAGGGTGGGTFDPTLLYAMAQRQPAARTAVVNSLGGRIPVGTGRY